MGGGPKRGKKKNRHEDDDQQFSSGSKWAQVLQDKHLLQEADPEQLYSNPTKQIFDYDFSKSKLVYTQEQKTPVNRDKYADYTAQELEQLKKMKQKAKVDKQVKNKIKNQKRKQRKKQVDAQKQKLMEEKAQEILEQKRIKQQIQKNKKKQGNSWTIPIALFSFLVLMVVLQYNQEIYVKLAKFRNDDVDYYQVLQIDKGATDKDIKQKYKKLVLKYHPDRNPNCQDCKQKFDTIMEAWEILGNPQKRQNYDRNSGVISQIKSSAVTLTPRNYQYLVQESTKLWIIQVYDSTSSYSRYFNQFWEDVLKQYSDIVNFGRIDSWHQSDMLSYVPYRFQIFPGLYIIDRGNSDICSVDFQRPMQSIRRCIQNYLQNIIIQQTKQFPSLEQIKSIITTTNKLPVKLNLKLRNSPRIKAINQIYSQYFQFYFVDDKQTKKSATIFRSSQKGIKAFQFNFTDSSKKIFKKYDQFLESHIIKKLSMCQFIYNFQETQCLLILNQTFKANLQLNMPLSKQLPIVFIKDQHEQLTQQIDKIKNNIGINQNFEVALYESNKIDLGYIDEISELDSSMGELIYFECKVNTWMESIISAFQETFNKIIDIFK